MKFCKKCQCDTERRKSGECKPCSKVRNAAYRAANSATIAEYLRIWVAANPTKVQSIKSKWRAANPEKTAASSAAYDAANPEKVRARKAAWFAANPKKASIASASYRANHPAKVAASTAAWRAANVEKLAVYRAATRERSAAFAAHRRASKLQRTPKWLTLAQLSLIEEMYLNAKLMGQFDGLKYHVDHIVPLQGKTVSGLHVPWNLQLLTASENSSKHNSTWPDMP